MNQAPLTLAQPGFLVSLRLLDASAPNCPRTLSVLVHTEARRRCAFSDRDEEIHNQLYPSQPKIQLHKVMTAIKIKKMCAVQSKEE